VSLFGGRSVLSIIGVIPLKRAWLLIDVPRRGREYFLKPSREDMKGWTLKLVARLNDSYDYAQTGNAVVSYGGVCSDVVLEHMYERADLVLNPHMLVGAYWAAELGLELQETNRVPLARQPCGFPDGPGGTLIVRKRQEGTGTMMDFGFIFDSLVARDWPFNLMQPCPCGSQRPFGACHRDKRCPLDWAGKLDGFTL